MKKVIYLAVVMLIAMVAMSLTGCGEVHDHHGFFSAADSAKIVEITSNEVNPVFNNPTEAQSYQIAIQDRFAQDSTFRTMTPKQIFDVSTVLQKRGVELNVKNIVSEFTRTDVYGKLPDKQIEEPRATSDTIIVDSITPDGYNYRIIKTK